MIRKEREQRNFFDEMERNILKRLDCGLGNRIGSSTCSQQEGACTSPGSIQTEAPYDEVLHTPDETMQIQESWVQSWITNDKSSSPFSLTSTASSPSLGSLTSIEDDDDTIVSLKQSKLDRAIDKPKLVRTISKMEYDLTLLLQGSSSAMETSPNGVEALLSPGDRSASDLLASLCFTQEAEGVGCNLLHPLLHPFDPASPGNTSLSSIDTDHDTSSSSCSAFVPKPNMTKRNTCGTIYLGSTLSSPDKDALIKCVCGVYRAHLLQSQHDYIPEKEESIFDDDYESDRTNRNRPFLPTLQDITNFYRDVFLRSQMEVDCIVISLIYIERLVKITHGRLHPTLRNWKSLLFSCMVLASKVWDDLSMWNADFSKIGPSGVTFSLKRTNELEIALLTALEYKVKVGASEYAKYYFLLRSMLCRSGLANDNLTTLEPLDVDGVKSLEKTGASFCELGVAKPFVRVRSKSLGDVETNREDHGSEASFNAIVGGSPKVQTHKVSLEHLVRM